MGEAQITRYIFDTFDGIETETVSGDTFFFSGPDHKFPFVTLVTSDAHDTVSDLNRPSVFRLNIGVSKPTFQALFGAHPAIPGLTGDGESDFDFTVLDKVLPHPIYGGLFWVCILNPSDATFEAEVRPFLAEAYDLAVGKDARRTARGRE